MQQVPGRDIVNEDVLLTELHHRFYNSLQVISSLAGGLMRADIRPADQRRAAAALQERVAVIGGLHRLLGRPPGDDLGPVCVDLCRMLASAFDREDAKIGVSVRCASMEPSTGRGLLLMLAELVTNAMKHTLPGFPLSIGIELSARVDAYELEVVSSGRSRGGEPSKRPRVASDLAGLLGGELVVESGRSHVVRVSLPRCR